ncbi:MAG: class I SAM-dependent methyltransferase [Gemmatimonadetes bacterium]|nr:class I SAM-dependent methyltransferase [Gemmatimonadota bacterium]
MDPMIPDGVDSLERIVPAQLASDDVTGRATLALHLERYAWAVQQVPHGLTLDLACGVGYGSVMLATRDADSFVVAADIAASALDEARRSYRHARVAHVRGDGAGWCRPGRFAAIVSLETVEHVDDPHGLLRDFARLLREDGVLVTSVPVTPSVDANPHHRTDFTEASLLALGRAVGLEPVAMLRQVQPYSPIAVVSRTERRTRDLRPSLLQYYLHHPTAAWRRLWATLRHGFTNHYLTVAWTKRGPHSP